MKIISLFIFLFISIITILVELYLSKVGLGDPIRYDSNYIYGYAPKENQSKSRIRGAKVTINDVGLRTIYKWKNNSKNKIIFFGDSITYGGSYIDDSKTFTHLVCEKIKIYLCGNAGVNAYSVINIVMRSKYDKRFGNADKVFFVVAPGDFYRDYANSQTAHFYLNEKKFFLPAITEAISFVATKHDLNKYISKKNDTKIDQNKKDLINYSLNILEKEIQRLEIENKDVFLLYTIEKNDKKSKEKINNYILEKLRKFNIKNFFNLENTLDKDIYFYDSVHYNIKGHEAVSKKIISILSTF